MAAEYEVNIKLNTQQIERELKKVDKAVNNIGKGKGGKKQPILALPSTDQLSAATRKIKELDGYNRKIHLTQKQINKQTRDQALSIDTLVKTQEKRARLLNKINEMEAKGLNVSKLRKQLAKATTEQSNRRFGSAEKEFRVLEKSIRLEQSKLRILKEQRKGFASSPVRGTPTMMGSPAQIAAAGRQIASPIRGGLDFPGSPAFLAGATVSRTPFGPSFPTGGAALPVGGSTAIPGSPKAIQAAKATELRATQVQGSWSKALGQLQETAKIFESRNAQVRQSWTTALGQLSETAKNISTNRTARVKQSWATALGQLEETAKDISRSNATQRKKRRRQRFEQVGLGAGFPLLFGGGPGAVLGGAAGGLTGSFGAQIAFSAIGQQIDRFIASVAAVGTALTSASGTVEMFREKNLFSSDAVKQHAFELEEQGRMQELATLLTKDLASQIGKNAVESFQLLGGETKEFLKTINHLFLAVQGFVAGPLAKLLSAINTVLGGVSTDVQFGSLRGSLTGDAAAQFEAIVAEARGTRELSSQERQRAISKGKPTDPVPGRLTTAVKEAVLKDPRVAKLRQTIDVTGQTTLDDTLGFKPPKDKAKAKAERQQLEAFLALNKQMTAELDRQDEINAMNGKYIAEQLNNADKINDSQEKRAGLLQAQINGTEDEFRLNQAIKEIKDKGLLPADEKRLIAAEKQIHAMEKQAKQVERLEQLYQQVGSAIENALVDGIMAAIDGTKSLQSIVSSLLKDVGKMFLQFGIRTALNSFSPSVFPMAQGGFVSSPTRALVGEGGQGEYVIPENKMRESMARYSRGARGSAVVPEAGASGTSGEGGGTAVAAPIDVRFNVERINNVDYVTAEQFQVGLQRAAQQGAVEGERRAMGSLRNSAAMRRRIGV